MTAKASSSTVALCILCYDGSSAPLASLLQAFSSPML
jgi:hypothetical protein